MELLYIHCAIGIAWNVLFACILWHIDNKMAQMQTRFNDEVDDFNQAVNTFDELISKLTRDVDHAHRRINGLVSKSRRLSKKVNSDVAEPLCEQCTCEMNGE